MVDVKDEFETVGAIEIPANEVGQALGCLQLLCRVWDIVLVVSVVSEG